ncbi:uncharacterized protein AMSG_04364 [Thecamonas trahens ATCC 50062]|uniref:Fibronectin type-III domain-containing protein n=1 Tax=Thecamonas trahens ATCC 50062 TaxID=461836 RepID=A0A0L0D7H0_THETB|nr:hypothetical protein AMSG_04364 [Thecamonas trahens ATCC 50062]KNC48135.1 hypothetical protein AMSG_04364 [Thecamonas trahens ATCC 50062]|eukprot:XP_013758705.1 hypothetical protein AMSG_04364 [Thecamonas trahens ATCC 50062]
MEVEGAHVARISSTQATICWQLHPSASQYKVEYTVVGTEISLVQRTTENKVELTTLSPGTRYRVFILAASGETWPVSSTPTRSIEFTTTAVAAGSAELPRALACTNVDVSELEPPLWPVDGKHGVADVSHDSALIRWQPGCGDEAGFELQLVPLGRPDLASIASLAGIGGSIAPEAESWPPEETRLTSGCSLTVSGLRPETQYSVCVCAVNEMGERGPSSTELEFATKAMPLAEKVAKRSAMELALRSDMVDGPQAAERAAGGGDGPVRPVSVSKQQYLQARRLASPPVSPKSSTAPPPASVAVAESMTGSVEGLTLVDTAKTSLSFTWAPLAGASQYALQWSLANTDIEGEDVVSETHHTLRRLASGCEFRVRVVGIDRSGVRSLASRDLVVRTSGVVSRVEDRVRGRTLSAGGSSTASLAPETRLSHGLCTAGSKGKTRFFQLWSECKSCKRKVCNSCADGCHAGHDVVHGTTFLAFICGCGSDCDLRAHRDE